jgi:hypothetical protein
VRTRSVIVVLLAAAFATACAAEPSISELPAAAGGATGSEASVVAEVDPPAGPPPDGPADAQAVPIELPASALDFFRQQEVDCSQYASLVGRGDEGYPPRVEADRFSGAVLVRELDRDTAVIEDGRGTRLVVDQWSTTGVVLAESGQLEDPLPDPYRLACPPSQ